MEIYEINRNMRDGGEVMELQPIVTIPKMDWLPIEVVFVFLILILTIVGILGIYKEYSLNKNKK
ncbi:hypothetical protein JDS87_20635 [Bacillus cereus]|nr:hypothetical protein [Bacillus cereus]